MIFVHMLLIMNVVESWVFIHIPLRVYFLDGEVKRKSSRCNWVCEQYDLHHNQGARLDEEDTMTIEELKLIICSKGPEFMYQKTKKQEEAACLSMAVIWIWHKNS